MTQVYKHVKAVTSETPLNKIYTCIQCSVVFTAKRRQKYCSELCATRNSKYGPPAEGPQAPTMEGIPQESLPQVVDPEGWVYRVFSEDERLLYVGFTIDPRQRLFGHRSQSPWWAEAKRFAWTRFDERDLGLAAEREAISAEKPIYNKTFNWR